MVRVITLSTFLLILLSTGIFSQDKTQTSGSDKITDEITGQSKNNSIIPINQQQTPSVISGNGDAVSTGYSFASSQATVLGTTTNDDNIFSGLNIGFTFSYNGAAYTQFGVNVNGWMYMGSSVGASSYNPISTGTTNNVISAFGRDLQGQTGSALTYQTIGTAPYRVLIVSWHNYRKWNNTGDNFNFEIRLFETTNAIEFCFGTMINNTTASTVESGLRGSSSADYKNRTTTTNWSATTAGAANTATCAISTTVYPLSGVTFRWTGTSPVSGYTFAYANATTLGTTANDDDIFSANNIGFTFTFDGTAYTQFGLCTNGWIYMGSTIGSSTYTPISSGTTNNIISILANDLQGQAGTGLTSSINYRTIGTSPNRILLIYWTGYKKYSSGGAGDNFNFQIRLFEGTNVIQKQFGAFTVNTYSSTMQVGLRGASTSDYNNRTTTTSWAATTAGAVNSAACTLSNAVFPAAGQLYTLTPVVASPKVLSSITYNQASTAGTSQGLANQEILRLDFNVTGSTGTLPLNSIIVNSANINNADVSGVKLYRTTTTTFTTTNQLGTTQTFSGNTATFSGLAYDLPAGITYVWVVYNISASATIGNYVDAQINATRINVNGSTYPPSIQSPAGVRYIGALFAFDGASDNCFMHSAVTGTLDEWQRGTPTAGPASAYSTPYCWGTNISGNYSSNSNYALYTTGFKATTTSVSWSFYEWYSTESGYDFCYPEYRLNGGTWTAAVAGYSGANSGWLQRSFNITSAVNDRIEFRFRFTSDGSVEYTGWYVDNMLVSGASSSDVVAPAITYTVLGNTSSTLNRSFTGIAISDCESNVNTTSGTRPRCYYKKSTDANAFNDNTSSTGGWKWVQASGTVSPFDFTIDYSLLFGGGGILTGETVQYFVVAQDLAATPNVGINTGTFTGTPANVNLTGNFPIGGTINSYLITAAPLSGTYTIGAALFNKLTGLDLVVMTKTRMVKRMIEEPAGEKYGKEKSGDKKGEQSTSTGLMYGSSSTVKVRYEEIAEQYSELCTKDGKKYTGSLFVPNTNTGKGDDPLTAGDYATITAAVTDLNNRGVSGAVNFLLLDNNYPTETYPIQFNSSISGISAVNNVTLKPQTGVTATIPGTIASNASVKILSNYVTIDGSNSGGTDRSLTILNSNVTSPFVILVGSTGTTPLTSVMVKNCVITNGVNTSTAVVVSDATTPGNPGYFNTITFQNNNISNAYIGIYSTAATGSNLFIYNNLLNTSGATGIMGTCVYVQGFNGGTISGNDLGNIVNANAATNQRIGIWLASGTVNMTLEKNTIHDISYTGTGGYPANGIKISNSGTTGTGIVVKNNMIYNISADGDSYATTGGTYDPVAIYAFGSAQTGISIFNNSIYMTGATINLAGAYSIGIGLDDGSVADVRNNLIVNNLGTTGTGNGALCLACETGSSQLTACNNNDYYSNPATGVKGLVKMGTAGVDQTTIAGVRTATGKDGQSFNSSPVFISGTDLHITASDLSVSGRGTYIASVNSDFDGDSRETSMSTVNRPVDVGADQYAPSGYTGSPAILNGAVYQDGGANGIEIVSGAFSTTGVFSFPGVRPPNNSSGKIIAKRNTEPVKDKNLKGNLQNANSTVKTNNSNLNDGPLAVNVPWIYYNISGFNITTSPVTLRFYYNDEQLATISESNLAVAMWTGSSWEIIAGQSVNSTNNYIQLSFDDWLGGGNWPSPMTFALTDLTSPLPVDLCAFSAGVSARNISLAWKTCSEINNKGFDVERRVLVDPVNNRYSEWVKAAFINGHGTSNEEHLYNYSDTKMPAGKYQYRLRQVDYNGHDEYFTLNQPDVVEIGKPVKADVSQNYPNPSNPKSRIDYQIPFDGRVSLKVYDIIGREITTIVNEIKEAGFYTAEFDGSSLASGVYFYRIIAEGTGSQKFTATKKMILVK